MAILRQSWFALTISIGIITMADSHIVDRGESWESIADDYGISVGKLKEANPGITDAFSGLELNVPASIDATEIKRRKFLRQNPLYLEAQSFAASGNHKQAAKTYEKLIESHTNIPIDVYYNRGLAYYNCGKMHQTMNDMAYVKKHDTGKRFPDASAIYNRAEKIQAERDANNAALAGAIIGAATTVTATYFAAKATSDSQPTASSATTSSGSSRTSERSFHYDSDNDTDSSSKSSKKQSKCSRCGGKGFVVEYTASFGLDKKEYCAECGKTMMSSHYHVKCPSCKGSGYH